MHCILYGLICTESTNKGIIIYAMLSAQSQRANDTIPSALHGTSLCLVNVVSEPVHISYDGNIIYYNLQCVIKMNTLCHFMTSIYSNMILQKPLCWTGLGDFLEQKS